MCIVATPISELHITNPDDSILMQQITFLQRDYDYYIEQGKRLQQKMNYVTLQRNMYKSEYIELHQIYGIIIKKVRVQRTQAVLQLILRTNPDTQRQNYKVAQVNYICALRDFCTFEAEITLDKKYETIDITTMYQLIIQAKDKYEDSLIDYDDTEDANNANDKVIQQTCKQLKQLKQYKRTLATRNVYI